jgi:hypothetical protein
LLLLLRVSDCFDWVFVFPFLLLLFFVVCIFDVAKAGCDLYHLGINIFPLYNIKCFFSMNESNDINYVVYIGILLLISFDQSWF